MPSVAWLACSVALVACTKKDAGPTDVTPGRHGGSAQALVPPADAGAPPRPAPVDPAARATELLERQIAALEQAEPEDASFRATFDPDAVLLVPDPRLVKEPARAFRDAITQRAPHEQDSAISFRDLAASGTEHALWLTAVLAIKHDGTTYEVRVTELATAASGWKVVAAAFTLASEPSAGRDAPRPFGNHTEPGALTALVAEPAQLAGALAREAVVIGFTDRLQGAAAKEAVARLPRMVVDGKPREVHGTGWGYTIAQLAYEEPGRKFPLRISALLIAVPAAAGGWQVVALHYTD